MFQHRLALKSVANFKFQFQFQTWCGLFVAFLFLAFSEFIKRFMGKCRPNFFAMCQPVYNKSQQTDRGLWVTDYTCLHEEEGAESARSFPSGHSMFAILLFGAIGLLLETNRGDIRTDFTWATRAMIQVGHIIPGCRGGRVIRSLVFVISGFRGF